MGYSGRIQMICENSHYWTESDNVFDKRLSLPDHTCHICKHPVVWVNFVDDTNCDEFGIVNVDCLTESRTETKRDEQGQWVTIITHATYKVPNVGGFDPRSC